MPQLPQGNSLNQFYSKYLSKWNESLKYVRAYNFCYVKVKLSIVSEQKGQSIVTVLGKNINYIYFTYLLGTDLELWGMGASICNLAWRCITPSCYIC